MRFIILILVSILFYQSLAKADDIRDFQIEGISVGDDLLDHFTINKINNAYKNTYPNSKKFYGLQFALNEYELYKYIQIHLKTDTKYIVSSVIGGEFFNDIKKCYKKQSIITKDLKKAFPDAEFFEGKNNYPNDPKSSFTASEFYLSNFEFIVTCTDWSEKAEANGSKDSLRVEISTTEFSDFIRYEAYQ